jgi:hypothetical protein
MDSSILRTLRYITFGRYTPSYDGAYFLDKKIRETQDGEVYLHELDKEYPMLNTYTRTKEEWPSEIWNFQDRYGKSIKKVKAKSNPKVSLDESSEIEEITEFDTLRKKDIKKMLKEVKGLNKKRAKEIIKEFKKSELIDILENDIEQLKDKFEWFKDKFSSRVKDAWEMLKKKL